MKPKLSVALCTYNGEKFFQEQLDSIIHQLLQVDEIVICDDGSSDETIKIANHFKESHKEVDVQIIQNDHNLGVIRNFEIAISKCTGDIIFLSDQDDIWMTNKTKVLTDYFLNHNNIDLIFTDATLIGEQGNILSHYSLLDAVGLYGKCLKAWNNGLALEMVNQGNRCTGATMAFRKKLKDDILPFKKNINALHDEQLAIFCIKRNSIAVIKQPLIHYRIHGNNTIGIGNNFQQNPMTHHHYKDIFMPYAANDHINSVQDDYDSGRCRINFMNYRHTYYYNLKGKIILLSKLFSYIYYYRSYFFHFWIFDFYLGLRYLIRKSLSRRKVVTK